MKEKHILPSSVVVLGEGQVRQGAKGTVWSLPGILHKTIQQRRELFILRLQVPTLHFLASMGDDDCVVSSVVKRRVRYEFNSETTHPEFNCETNNP